MSRRPVPHHQRGPVAGGRQMPGRLGRDRFVHFDTGDLRITESGTQQRGVVPGAGADLQHPVPVSHLQPIQHDGHDPRHRRRTGRHPDLLSVRHRRTVDDLVVGHQHLVTVDRRQPGLPLGRVVSGDQGPRLAVLVPGIEPGARTRAAGGGERRPPGRVRTAPTSLNSAASASARGFHSITVVLFPGDPRSPGRR